MEKHVYRKLTKWNDAQRSELIVIRLSMQVDLEGLPHPITINSNNRTLDANWMERRISIRALFKDLDISSGRVQHIIRQAIGYSKVCSQWISQALNSKRKANRMAVCLKHLLRFIGEDNTFLQCFVAGYENWYHLWELDSKALTMRRRNPSFYRPNTVQ